MHTTMRCSGHAKSALLALLAAAGWMTRSARAQALVSQVTLTTAGNASYPFGAGYAKGYAYFCSGSDGDTSGSAVWKVDTGNRNGPSSAAPVEVNKVDTSAVCFDGAVDADGIGYWVLNVVPVLIAKTIPNGDGAMTLLGEYEIPGSNRTDTSTGASLALDQVNNMLYVGTEDYEIYKLSAGGPTQLPTLLNFLDLTPGVDGGLIYGLQVDPASGYGYAGTAYGSYSIVKFSLGAGNGAMTYIGRVNTASDVYGLGLNLATNMLYAGFYSTPPDGEAFAAGSGAALPTSLGNIALGESPGDGVYTNKAFFVSSECNYLFANANGSPANVNFFDLGSGQTTPTYKSYVGLPTDEGMAGTIDEYGYTYWTTGAYPIVVYKVSPPQCKGFSSGPFSLTGAKYPKTKPVSSARQGAHLKVTFSLTRWGAGYVEPTTGRRELTTLARNKTANGLAGAKVQQPFNVTIVLPTQQGLTFTGTPKVAPFIPKSKGPAVFNLTRVEWKNVPMTVWPGTKKNHTRKFTVALKLDKTVAVGTNLTFAATATGAGGNRAATLVVPVVAAHVK